MEATGPFGFVFDPDSNSSLSHALVYGVRHKKQTPEKPRG